MKGDPWSFDKHLVALKRVQKHIEISWLLFETISMWIQLHSLPIRLSPSTIKSIVSEVGEVIENTPRIELFEGCNFLRVRVGVDFTKPLCRG